MFAFPSPQFFHYAVYFTEGVALLANTLVVYLILTETNKDLVEYSSVLILNCLVDYTCTFLNIINQAYGEIIDGFYVHVFEGPVKYLPREYLFICAGLYSFTVAFALAAMPIQFAYRWFLIKKGRRLSSTNLVFLTSLSFLCACYFWCNLAACFYNTDETFPDLSFLHKDPYIYNKWNPAPIFVVGNLMTAAGLGLLIVGLLIWYFAFDTYLALKRMKNKMHENTKKLQRQMNWMLFAQTAMVLFSAVEPVILLLIMMIFKIDIYGMGTMANLLISFIPSLNSLCTLFLVSRFRNRAFQMICFWKHP